MTRGYDCKALFMSKKASGQKRAVWQPNFIHYCTICSRLAQESYAFQQAGCLSTGLRSFSDTHIYHAITDINQSMSIRKIHLILHLNHILGNRARDLLRGSSLFMIPLDTTSWSSSPGTALSFCHSPYYVSVIKRFIKKSVPRPHTVRSTVLT